ncbi:Pc17g01160 [Penicillium rubens Wisconsin 54-1255]|uniref:Pc17g01160 protein n=2 Tax=Penicillium chrysogenum species complex TaxID=254878 RepID=B6HB35_PENRW|nr:Pc17g01160 [Penicillium rubens Wisconsin 54-1255]
MNRHDYARSLTGTDTTEIPSNLTHLVHGPKTPFLRFSVLALLKPLNTMPPQTTTIIDGEFERLKSIQMNALDKNVMAFLEATHKSVQAKGIYNPRGPFERSLIHYAAMGDCTELLLQLLETEAPIEDRDQNKRTPLSWAAEYGSYNVTKILVQNGAQVNSLDDTYTSPLTWLKYAGHPDCKSLPATKRFLKSNGATTRGFKRAWILQKLGRL